MAVLRPGPSRRLDAATEHPARSPTVPAPAGRRELRSAAVYAVGAALPRAIGFVLLPIYTRAVTPAEYGTLSLLMAGAAALSIVLTLGLDVAIFRTFFQLSSTPDRQREFVDSMWRFLVIVPISGALAIGAVLWVILSQTGRIEGTDAMLAALTAGFSVSATVLPLALLRAQERLRDYLVITVTAALTTAGLTLLFVVGLDAGVRGWVLSTTLANAFTLGVAALVVPWNRAGRFDASQVRSSVALGLPLVPHFLSHWALQLADRLVLAGIVTSAALGVYSFASNLALPALILVAAINQGFMPTYARAGVEHGHERSLERIVVLQTKVVALLCVTGALVASPTVSIIAPPAYAGAGPLVGWIVLGYAFLGLYYIPMNGVSLGAGRTRFAAVATLLGAATNLLLLIVWTPTGGLHAAAIASAIGYAVLLCGTFIYSRGPDNPVTYPWRELVIVLLLAVAVYGSASVTTPDAGWAGLGLRCVWIAALALALFGRSATASARANHVP